jgi:hypothetical protein
MTTTHTLKPLVKPWQVQQAVQAVLEGHPDFPTLIQGLILGLQGNASGFVQGAGVPLASASSVWANVHTCNDMGEFAEFFFRPSLDQNLTIPAQTSREITSTTSLHLASIIRWYAVPYLRQTLY